jgi:hypothetical protein
MLLLETVAQMFRYFSCVEYFLAKLVFCQNYTLELLIRYLFKNLFTQIYSLFYFFFFFYSFFMVCDKIIRQWLSIYENKY